MPRKLIIGVVGVGAVGTVLAGRLAEAGAGIIAADIPNRIAQIKRDGLRVRWADGDCEQRVDTVDSIRSLGQMHPDCIIVATKDYSLKQIMPEVAAAAGDDTIVISAENGIDTEDAMARHVPPHNVGRMVVNYAGGSDAEGVTRVIWFNPPNYFGLLTDREEPRLVRLVEMLNSVGLTSEIVSPTMIKKYAFLKTVLTSALMPICAVMNLTMKEAMSGKATRELAGDVVREGLSVAARCGHEYPEDMWQKCMGYLDKGGDHHPSMSVDLRSKRPTEIDFINGKILEIGRKFDNLELPVNRVVTALLMTQEVRNGTRKPDQIPDHVILAARPRA